MPSRRSFNSISPFPLLYWCFPGKRFPCCIRPTTTAHFLISAFFLFWYGKFTPLLLGLYSKLSAQFQGFPLNVFPKQKHCKILGCRPRKPHQFSKLTLGLAEHIPGVPSDFLGFGTALGASTSDSFSSLSILPWYRLSIIIFILAGRIPTRLLRNGCTLTDN